MPARPRVESGDRCLEPREVQVGLCNTVDSTDAPQAASPTTMVPIDGIDIAFSTMPSFSSLIPIMAHERWHEQQCDQDTGKPGASSLLESELT